jgi:hypothetical protein
VVTIEILAEGLVVISDYALIFDYDVFAPQAESVVVSEETSGISSPPGCDPVERRCIGVNGLTFGAINVRDSINTFTLGGLSPGTVVQWTTAASDFESRSPDLPFGSFTVVPEPATASLILFGLGVLAAVRHRSRPIAPFGCLVASSTLVLGQPSHALSVNLLENRGTADGGVVVIEVLGEGDSADPLGYELNVQFDVLEQGAFVDVAVFFPSEPTWTVGTDPNAVFGSVLSCTDSRCNLANGGTSSNITVSDSVNTVTWSGLAAGAVVNWTTENTIGLSKATNLPSGSFTVIPEPGTAGLVALGAASLATRRRRGMRIYCART